MSSHHLHAKNMGISVSASSASAALNAGNIGKERRSSSCFGRTYVYEKQNAGDGKTKYQPNSCLPFFSLPFHYLHEREDVFRLTVELARRTGKTICLLPGCSLGSGRIRLAPRVDENDEVEDAMGSYDAAGDMGRDDPSSLKKVSASNESERG
jgi:hypothetical protein